jgi:hypothetical protein
MFWKSVTKDQIMDAENRLKSTMRWVSHSKRVYFWSSSLETSVFLIFFTRNECISDLLHSKRVYFWSSSLKMIGFFIFSWVKFRLLLSKKRQYLDLVTSQNYTRNEWKRSNFLYRLFFQKSSDPVLTLLKVEIEALEDLSRDIYSEVGRQNFFKKIKYFVNTYQ